MEYYHGIMNLGDTARHCCKPVTNEFPLSPFEFDTMAKIENGMISDIDDRGLFSDT